MCFYDQTVWSCNDFKWGHFKAHCNREYRSGETCGMKFTNEVTHLQDLCKLCEKLATKERRITKELERVARWRKEGGKRASIEKSLEMVTELEADIQKINETRGVRLNKIGSGRSSKVSHQHRA